MRYASTRGGIAPVGFAEAVKMGLATDGGLLVPTALPTVDPETLADWARLRFPDLALELMSQFVGDALPRVDLTDLINRSFATFSHPEVTPLVPVGRCHVLELFHGPTAAFKDVALQFLGNLFEYLLARDGGELNILGATSGDTGSAAIAGVRGKDRIGIVILHPQGRISPIQERQMTTVLDANVRNVAVRGTFDDAQRLVKALFNDLPAKQRYSLGAVNSINWARILAQMTYYFYAWGRMARGDPEHRVSFSVPTGNFGDIFAAYLAKRIGLPVARLILATNRNDILARFVRSGVYSASEVYATLSPAMDIQIASNFERYLYYLVGEDPARVRSLLGEMAATGQLGVTSAEQRQVRADFDAASIDDAATLEQIRETYSATGYILDPHTAIGVRAGGDWSDLVCLATAHPAKFNQAVHDAIGCEAPAPPSLRGLMDKPTRCDVLDASEAALRGYLADLLG